MREKSGLLYRSYWHLGERENINGFKCHECSLLSPRVVENFSEDDFEIEEDEYGEPHMIYSPTIITYRQTNRTKTAVTKVFLNFKTSVME